MGVIILTTTTYKDYVPHGNHEFNSWQAKFIAAINANLAKFGIDPANDDWLELKAEQVTWNDKWAKGKPQASGGRTSSDTKAMQQERKKHEKKCRNFTQAYLARNKKVSGSDKALLGITVSDNTRTYHPVPDYGPHGAVHTVKHGIHKISFSDPEHSESKALPLGASLIRVYWIITDVHAAEPDDGSYTMLDDTSANEYMATFKDHDRGKKAWYYGRYKDSRHKLSPPGTRFSEIII